MDPVFQMLNNHYGIALSMYVFLSKSVELITSKSLYISSNFHSIAELDSMIALDPSKGNQSNNKICTNVYI